MDKFGIFKLLSTLSNASSASNGEKLTLQDVLNSLPKQTENNPTDAENTKSVKKNTPISSPLLDTMKSHDEFVKRVNKNNPK